MSPQREKNWDSDVIGSSFMSRFFWALPPSAARMFWYASSVEAAMSCWRHCSTEFRAASRAEMTSWSTVGKSARNSLMDHFGIVKSGNSANMADGRAAAGLGVDVSKANEDVPCCGRARARARMCADANTKCILTEFASSALDQQRAHADLHPGYTPMLTKGVHL